MKVLIVGGGTAGLVSALILKEFLNTQVDLVYSDSVGIIGVGEGSTEHFSEFMNFVGIDHYSIIKECDATYKSGIMFQDWGVDSYLHSVSSDFDQKSAQYSYTYAKKIIDNDQYLVDQSVWNNKIDKWFMNKNEISRFNQYHFNTYKLNDFLKRKAEESGINLFEDTIEEVFINPENGNIDSLRGIKSDYDYDFYIDSTGFKRLLIGKMGAEWKSFGEYLKANSAVTFQTEDEDEYNLWTLAKGMDYGWMFRLPVWGRYGNGYIFNNDHVSMDKAKEEASRLFKKDLNFGKEFSFDPGYLKNVWIKNCVALGVSGSFVEPLEATSIGTSIQQTFLLMHKIINYTEKDIERYNKSFNDIMENIRDFVFLHYMTGRNDTAFWKEVNEISPPDSLAENLSVWKNRLPIAEDFSGLSDYILFREANFINVLHGLKKFDNQKIKQEFYFHNEKVKLDAQIIINENMIRDNSVDKFGHKKFISLIRDNF